MAIKQALSQLFNNTLVQLWVNSPPKSKILVGSHNIDCFGSIRDIQSLEGLMEFTSMEILEWKVIQTVYSISSNQLIWSLKTQTIWLALSLSSRIKGGETWTLKSRKTVTETRTLTLATSSIPLPLIIGFVFLKPIYEVQGLSSYQFSLSPYLLALFKPCDWSVRISLVILARLSLVRIRVLSDHPRVCPE